MSRKFQDVKAILSAKGATGIGTPMLVSDFMHLVLSFATASNANLTVKFQGSISDECPDFSAAQSVTNMWDYIQVKDLEDGSSIDGDTGVACAGTDDFRQFELNVNGLKWINAVVTARSAGAVTVSCMPFSNE
jgi:hypothetical protein